MSKLTDIKTLGRKELSRITQENQLALTKLLNTESMSGKINSTSISNTPVGINFEDYTSGSFNAELNPHMYSLVSALKNWNYSKFVYNNLPEGIDQVTMANQLFTWGSIAIFQYKGKYLALPYTTDEWDIYGNPYKVTPIATGKSEIQFKSLTVGKNVVVIHSDVSGIMITTNKNNFGKLFQVWEMLEHISQAYYAIRNNMVLGVQRLAVGDAEDSTRVENIRASLQDMNPVIQFDINAIAQMGQLTGSQTGGGILNFENRQTDVWQNYKNYIETVKQYLGMESNPSPDKKERQITTEVESSNIFANSILQTEYEMLEMGIEQMNETFGTNTTIEPNPEFENDVQLGEQENNQEEVE